MIIDTEPLQCSFDRDIEYILPVTQEKGIIPSREQQEVTPDNGYTGLSKVTVEAVTNEIDSNIQPNNIKLGVNILGVDGNLEPDKPDQTKTITPTEQTQTIKPDTGYELAEVTVEPIPSEYVIPNGTIEINSNGITNVGGYENANVNVEFEPLLQSKSVIPSEETQNIEADENYDGLSNVIVNPIPDEYIKPSGTLDITSNGTYDVKSYESANVNVGSFVINDYRFLFQSGARLNILNDLLPLCKGGIMATSMFNYCDSYTGTLDLSSLDVSKIYRLDNMFYGFGINSDGNINLILPEITNTIDTSSMFNGYGGKTLDISPIVNGQSKSSSYMFWNAKFTKLIINKPYVFPINSNDLKGTTIEKATGYVYVPDDMVDTYKSATNWSTYASQIKGMSELV